MGSAPSSRRPARGRLVGLLIAGLLAACSPSSRTSDATLSSSSTTAAPATTTTTAPPPLPPDGSPPFDRVNPMSGFIAFGDSGGGADQGAVADSMERWVAEGHRVDALVTTGDNVYDFGEPRFFEAHLKAPYRELQAGPDGGIVRPLWATLGNHDVMRGHGAEQLAFLGLPPLPYARTLPGVRFLFLDANRPGDAAQTAWLKEQLADPAPPPFTVAVFHQPVFSCGIHGRTETVITAWYDLLNSGQVSLVLTGHDHQYQRFLTAEGTTFIVTGGGGRNLYRLIPNCTAPEMRAGAVKHHFTGIEIYSDRMSLTAVTPTGEVLDRIDIPAPLPAP